MAQKYLSKLGGDYASIRSWNEQNEQNEQTNQQAYDEHEDWLWAERQQAECQAPQIRHPKTHKSR